MELADFLRVVWPEQGPYALATPFVTPDGVATYSHAVVDSIPAAIQQINIADRTKDVYFCVHSLAAPRVWNPQKKNRKTGDLGAFEIRTHKNMAFGRALFFDLDVSANSPEKYASQRDALAGLIQFTKTVKLPKPFATSSGNGIHVFWPLADAIPSSEWTTYAIKIKQLAQHYGLRVDPARTTDVSSVLRPPGTRNHKNPNNLKAVSLLVTGQVTPNDVMQRILDDALIVANITPQKPKNGHTHPQLGSNTQREFEAAPVSYTALVTACNQVRNALQNPQQITEPLWYATIGLVRYCENGNRAAHHISRGHPEYSHDATEAKLYQLESKQIGPTTCSKFEELNPAGCVGCPRHGLVNSPLSATRQTERAPAPVIPAPIELPEVPEVTIPEPPSPYIRLRSGKIGVEVGDKDDPEKVHTEIILEYDFHPVRRLADTGRGCEVHLWRANLPRAGYTDVILDADVMYDTRKLFSALAHKGIFPRNGAIALLRDYMVAYINTLQAVHDAETVYGCLGWTADHGAFILPTKALNRDGTVTPAQLSLAAQRSTAHLVKHGTLEGQVRALKFFNATEYAPNQFAICAALGSTIFFATGHNGIIINLSGPRGSSKSTTLYTGAALWGDPWQYCLNGTNNGVTPKARNNRMMVMSNLPHMVDEITNMLPKDAIDMAMTVTQPGGRIGLEAAGIEARRPLTPKSSIMLTTANTSLYAMFSAARADSTAESARVLEIQCQLNGVHTKADADKYMIQLRENYGHIGEVFMQYVVQNFDYVHSRILKVVHAFDLAANVEPGERFWSAAAGAAIVACEIANKLGLLDYKPKNIWDWLIKEQMPSMRENIADQYIPAVGILAEYLELINGNILVTQGGAAKPSDVNLPNIIRQPQNGQLLARLEMDAQFAWVMKKAFKDYCTRYGHNYLQIIRQLYSEGVLIEKHTKKCLGMGTEYAKGQSYCMLVDMSHPNLVGEKALPKRLTGKVVPMLRGTSFISEYKEMTGVDK